MLIFSHPQSPLAAPPAQALAASGALVWGAPALPSTSIFVIGFKAGRTDQTVEVARARAAEIVAKYNSASAPAPDPAPAKVTTEDPDCLEWQEKHGVRTCVKTSVKITSLVQISGSSINDEDYERLLTSMGVQWIENVDQSKDKILASDPNSIRSFVDSADTFMRGIITNSPIGMNWSSAVKSMTLLPWAAIPWATVPWGWFQQVGRFWSKGDWQKIAQFARDLEASNGGPVLRPPQTMTWANVKPEMPMQTKIIDGPNANTTRTGPSWVYLGETWGMPWTEIPFDLVDFSMPFTVVETGAKVTSLVSKSGNTHLSVQTPDELILNMSLAFLDLDKPIEKKSGFPEKGTPECISGEVWDEPTSSCVATPTSKGASIPDKNQKTNRGRGFDFADQNKKRQPIDRDKRGRGIQLPRDVEPHDRGEAEATPDCIAGKVRDPVTGTCISPDEMALRKACRDKGNTFVLGKGCVASGGGKEDDGGGADGGDEEDKKSSTGLLLGVGLLAVAAVGAAYVLTRPPPLPPSPSPEEPLP